MEFAENTSVQLPSLPDYVYSAGKIIDIPHTKPLAEQANGKLLLALRNSEVRNARAVRGCIEYEKQIKTVYANKKVKEDTNLFAIFNPPKSNPKGQ